MNKYATIDEQGHKYKDMAQKMTEMGYPMSTTYANSTLIKALESLIFKIMKKYNHPIKKEYIKELASSSDFQNNIAPIIRKVYKEKKNAS